MKPKLKNSMIKLFNKCMR